MDGTKRGEIPLSEVAFRIGKPWRASWDLVLSRKIEGRKVDGRWMVNAESVEKYLADREHAAA